MERLVNNPPYRKAGKPSSLWRGWYAILAVERLVHNPLCGEAGKPSSLWKG
jgi:hypothetical protein